MSVLMRSVIEAETDMTRKVRYVPLPSAALAAWTSLPRWAPPEPLGYPGRYQTPGFYKCVAAERQTVRALTPRIQEQALGHAEPGATYCDVAVLEAHVLNHDNRRRNLPTGRKIK